MSKLLQNKAFMIGFASGIFSSIIIQLTAYAHYVISKNNFTNPSGMNIDMVWRWGIPFPIFYGESFNAGGLIGNTLVAIVFSFILGLIFKFVWSKISQNKLSQIFLN